MIKRFKIFENSLYSSLKKIEDVKTDDNWVWKGHTHELVNDEKEELIRRIIGDDVECEISFPDYSDVSLHFKDYDFTDFVGGDVENGSILWCLNVTNYYSDYYFDIDRDELNYINSYLSGDNCKLIDKLCKLLDVDTNKDEIISDLFLSLGGNLDYDDMLSEISTERTRSVEAAVGAELKALPFTLSHSNKFDIEVEIEFEKIGEYIEKNKLEGVNTLEELFVEIDFSSLSYELEYDNSSNYVEDYKDLNMIVENQLEELIDKLDNSEEKFTDPNQLDLFKNSDVEFKSPIKHIKYEYQIDVFSKLNMEQLRYAEDIGGKVLAWFKSYEFQKNYMIDPDLKKYKELKSKKILNPAIEYEYEYLQEVENYNL